MTFGSLAGRICDPHRMVADSAKLGKPIIIVALNYRLNIFGFGNGQETNLALKDQALAVEWIRKHIGGFGGDPVCSTAPSSISDVREADWRYF